MRPKPLAIVALALLAGCNIPPEKAFGAARDRARELVDAKLGGPAHDMGDMSVGLDGEKVFVCGRVQTLGESRPFVVTLGDQPSVDLVLARLEEVLNGQSDGQAQHCTGEAFDRFLNEAYANPSRMTALIRG